MQILSLFFHFDFMGTLSSVHPQENATVSAHIYVCRTAKTKDLQIKQTNQNQSASDKAFQTSTGIFLKKHSKPVLHPQLCIFMHWSFLLNQSLAPECLTDEVFIWSGWTETCHFERLQKETFYKSAVWVSAQDDLIGKLNHGMYCITDFYLFEKEVHIHIHKYALC